MLGLVFIIIGITFIVFALSSNPADISAEIELEEQVGKDFNHWYNNIPPK